jgi:hypothetical protein
MAFLYETHLHSRESSVCGQTPAKEYIQPYIDLGYTGVFFTDHFTGNTSYVPERNTSWVAQVRRFCKGYESARNEGERRGLQVFFAWEQTFEGDDYLVYGLDSAWLLAHPDYPWWSRKRQFMEVSAAGGAIVHAHPCRQRAYIPTIVLSPYLVHGVEVANLGNMRESDAVAYLYAEKLGLPQTAGSDMHHLSLLRPGGTCGVYLHSRLENEVEYAQILQGNGRGNLISGLLYPEGRLDTSFLREAYSLQVPQTVLDEDESIISRDLLSWIA